MTEKSTPPEEQNAGNWIDLARDRANTYTLLSRIWGAEIDPALWEALGRAQFPRLDELPELDAAYCRLETACRDSRHGCVVNDFPERWAQLERC